MLKHSLIAALILSFAVGVVSAETKPVSTEVGTGTTDAAWTQHVVQSYLHLQDQQQATLRAVEESRREAAATARATEEARQQTEAAARRTTERFTARLDQIEQNVVAERARELEALQRSQRFTLTVISLLGAAAFASVLLLGVFLLRAMQRRMDAVTAQAFGVPLSALDGAPALGTGDTDLVPADPAARSSARLHSAVSRLEQRLQELETGDFGTPLTPVNGAVPPATDPEAEKVARVALLLGKGQTLLNLRQPENALPCFDEALSLDDSNPDCHVKKGAALEHLGRLDDAIECYDRAIAIDNSMTMAYLSKGGVFNRLERYNEALECYEQALRAEKKTSIA